MTPESIQQVESPKFECFPNLPLEIRLKIWRTLCFIPRNVGLWAEPLGESTGTKFFRDSSDMYQPVQIDANVGIPALLHASKEAINEGLKHYTLEFDDSCSGRISRADVEIDIEPRAYVNLDVDVLCLMTFDGEFESRFVDSLGVERMQGFFDHLSRIVERRNRLLDSVAVSAPWVKCQILF
jgi:hypothetical protein